MSDNPPPSPPVGDQAEPSGLALIAAALDRLKYGAIQLTVHDGKLVQVDVTERTRLTS